ncbi:MAG: Crp/Fnr family transcriptional regulator, partial [Haliea sp.]
RAGEPGNELFRVESGNVRIFNVSEDGRELLYDLFPVGTCFGESSLIDRGLRPHTTQAIGEVVLQVLSREHFERAWKVYPEVSWAVARLQTSRARRLYGFYERVSMDALCRRTARRLWLLAKTMGQQCDDGIHFDIRITQDDIGSLVAGSRQSVNKVLRQWQEDGVIDLAYGSLVVREMAELERLAMQND